MVGRIVKVLGVGGGGCNAVSRMCPEALQGVEYYAINTDGQDLFHCSVPNQMRIGLNLTDGRGTGARPELGRQAAEEESEDIAKALEGADIVFLVAGMGGGTGTGASPVIAQIAKEGGAIAVAVVSQPFSLEGSVRRANAVGGIELLQNQVDILVIVSNDDLGYTEEELTFESAMKATDDMVARGVRAVVETASMPGEIDLATMRSQLQEVIPNGKFFNRIP